MLQFVCFWFLKPEKGRNGAVIRGSIRVSHGISVCGIASKIAFDVDFATSQQSVGVLVLGYLFGGSNQECFLVRLNRVTTKISPWPLVLQRWLCVMVAT